MTQNSDKEPNLALLVCPQTGKPLTLKDGELYTEQTSYPLFNGVPWLFKNPEFAFFEWATKIKAHINETQRHLAYLQLLANNTPSVHARQRYEQLFEAQSFNLQYETQCLSFFLGQNDIHLQPSTQQVQSYFKNIFRDWCWGAKENAIYMDYIKKTAPKAPDNILVLGAGAGKLSQLIAQHYSSSRVYSIDHNPFLVLTAQRILNGGCVELFDYAHYPNRLDNTNKKVVIQNQPTLSNHQCVLTGFPDLPFPEDSFDLIVAPWFYDILEQDIQESIGRTLKFLTQKGSLIHIGPSNVHHPDVDKQYCLEEVVEMYQQFFAETEVRSQQMAYLNNPIESQARLETVMFLHANHKTQSYAGNKQSIETRVTLTPALASLKEEQALKAQILNLIDKDLTSLELAERMANAFNMDATQAAFYAESFIKKLKLEM